MTSTLTALGFGARDPLGLARFWATALRWEISERNDQVTLVPTDGTEFSVLFLPSPAVKKGKNRIHLDLTSSSIEDQRQTVETLLALGARHIDIGQTAEEGHVVLADPEGNELCIIAPENNFLATCGRFGSITCDSSRPGVGYFWSEALGWPLVWDQDEETAIRAPDGTGPFITWGPPLAPKVGPNRLQLDIAPAEGDEFGAEVDRLVALGATRIDNGAERIDGVSMADPDDNEFRVTSPR